MARASKATWTTVTFCVAVATLLSAGPTAASRGLLKSGVTSSPPSTFLYVWAGAANTSSDKDSLFVIDVDKASPSYGQVINVVTTPYNGMEPHHCKVSTDRRLLGCSGLLSVLAPGPPPTVVFFDLEADPRNPQLIPGVAQPVLSAIGDEFQATPGGGFLATMMGSASGGSPGRVVKYDRNRNLIGEYPQNPPSGFNPHGIAVDWARGTMLTADFVEPASTLLSQPGPLFRTTVRLWRLEDMTITRTYDLASMGVHGMMDAALAGNGGAFYFSGGTGLLFYVDPGSDKPPSVVFDFGIPGSLACILRPFRRGTRLLASLLSLSKVFLLDISKPHKPKLLDAVQFPADAGSHVAVVSSDERLAAVATYFLVEGPGGRVNVPGDRTVRILALDRKAKHLDDGAPCAKTIDFKTIGGGFNPHGLAFY